MAMHRLEASWLRIRFRTFSQLLALTLGKVILASNLSLLSDAESYDPTGIFLRSSAGCSRSLPGSNHLPHALESPNTVIDPSISLAYSLSTCMCIMQPPCTHGPLPFRTNLPACMPNLVAFQPHDPPSPIQRIEASLFLNANPDLVTNPSACFKNIGTTYHPPFVP